MLLLFILRQNELFSTQWHGSSSAPFPGYNYPSKPTWWIALSTSLFPVPSHWKEWSGRFVIYELSHAKILVLPISCSWRHAADVYSNRSLIVVASSPIRFVERSWCCAYVFILAFPLDNSLIAKCPDTHVGTRLLETHEEVTEYVPFVFP